MNTFFIGDSHFGHKNIINFPELQLWRGYQSIGEHDEELIRRWNAVVRPKDIVWHLGDFCFGKKSLPIAGRLNGDKRLVLGNHDTYPTQDYLRYFNKVYGAVEWHGMILTHIPAHECQLRHFTHNIHGHLHHNSISDIRYINVSCEAIDCTPVSWDDLRRKAGIA